MVSSLGGRGRGEIIPSRSFPQIDRGLLTGLGAEGAGLPPVVRRGEPVCPGREAGRRASAAGPGAKPELDEQRSARFGARTRMSAADFDRRQDGEGQSPSARTVGQASESREPDAGGRTSGGGLSFGDFSLATQRKIIRSGPKGGRNTVEGRALVSCMAEPC